MRATTPPDARLRELQLDSPTRALRDEGRAEARLANSGLGPELPSRGPNPGDATGAFRARELEERNSRADTPPAWQVETLRSRRAGECLNRLSARVALTEGASHLLTASSLCIYRTHLRMRRGLLLTDTKGVVPSMWDYY